MDACWGTPYQLDYLQIFSNETSLRPSIRQSAGAEPKQTGCQAPAPHMHPMPAADSWCRPVAASASLGESALVLA